MHRSWQEGCKITVALETSAGVIALHDLAINSDGTITTTIPNGSTLNAGTGIGSIHMIVSSAGPHFGFLFVDHEMSETLNGFANELGEVSRVPRPAGLFWEIDEPGFSAFPGDIYDNFLLGALDNTIGKSGPDDVSMAMGWKFALEPGETGLLTFVLEAAKPASFYLRQFDTDSGDELFFSSSLSIVGTVPDGDLGVEFVALGALLFVTRWQMQRQKTAGRDM